MFSTVILCTMVKRVYNKELHCNFISAQQETGAEVKRRRTKAKMKLIFAVALLLSAFTVAVNSDNATEQGYHHGHGMYSKKVIHIHVFNSCSTSESCRLSAINAISGA